MYYLAQTLPYQGCWPTDNELCQSYRFSFPKYNTNPFTNTTKGAICITKSVWQCWPKTPSQSFSLFLKWSIIHRHHTLFCLWELNYLYRVLDANNEADILCLLSTMNPISLVTFYPIIHSFKCIIVQGHVYYAAFEREESLYVLASDLTNWSICN